MIKRALKFALFLSLGWVVGGTILTKIFSPVIFDETYLEFSAKLLLSFTIAFTVSFLMSLFVEWISIKIKKLI